MPKSYDLSKIKLFKDSALVEGFYMEGNKVLLNGPLEPAKDYKLILDEGAGVSIHDSLSLADTLLFATRRAEYYSTERHFINTTDN